MFGFGINKVIYDNGRKRKRVACNTLSVFKKAEIYMKKAFGVENSYIKIFSNF